MKPPPHLDRRAAVHSVKNRRFAERTAKLLLRPIALCFALVATVFVMPSCGADGADPALATHLRRPVAIALVDHDRWLFVANERSGAISVIDTSADRVTAEHNVGRRLSDLAALRGEKYLVATDQTAGQLILLRRGDSALHEVSRIPMPMAPVSLEQSDDGGLLAVASLWAHRVTLVSLSLDNPDIERNGQAVRTVDLPFAPRTMCFIERSTKLVVADGFGGRLALIDVAAGTLLSVRDLPGHNLRAVATTPDGRWFLVAQQSISSAARASREDIHWGTLLRNNLRWLSLSYVASPEADLLAASRHEFLGGAGNGAADPSDVLVLPDGRAAVALSGVNAVLLGRVGSVGYQRIAVGRRPTALKATADGKRIYVANTLADSISVIDVSESRAVVEIALGPQPELSLADRGERLFYDGRLSHDGWMSCHSCHPDGHTNNQLVDNLSDGSYGNPKRVLTLLGASDTGPWAWNGGMSDIERQVRQSITSTMQGPEPTDDDVAALSAFVRSLEPPPPQPTDTNAAAAGRKLFDELGCHDCHTPPSYTSPGVFDAGTPDEDGRHKFNPPSLRGILQRTGHLHDNRAQTLDDVFRDRHKLPRTLSDAEIENLVTFLRLL